MAMTLEQEREAFEKWARALGISVMKRSTGGYVESYTRHVWEAFRAGISANLAQPAQAMPQEPSVVSEVLAELHRAIAKFPTWPTDPLHAAGVVNEEVGELNKAILQAVYEPHKNPPDAVRTEAVQAAAMTLRFLLGLPFYHYDASRQHTEV